MYYNVKETQQRKQTKSNNKQTKQKTERLSFVGTMHELHLLLSSGRLECCSVSYEERYFSVSRLYTVKGFPFVVCVSKLHYLLTGFCMFVSVEQGN